MMIADDFDDLNEALPRELDAGTHSHGVDIAKSDSWAVRTKHPGKYGDDDFVVEIKYDISDGFIELVNGYIHGWHQFKHRQFFYDFYYKETRFPYFMRNTFMPHLLGTIQGARPLRLYGDEDTVGMPWDCLQVASLTLAVCEFRRYPQGDVRGGGRYLPINFSNAIMGGYLTPSEASSQMQIGFPILNKLDGFTPFCSKSEYTDYQIPWRHDE